MAGICTIAWTTAASAWQATIKGSAGGEDRANAVSVDAAGDVIAALHVERGSQGSLGIALTTGTLEHCLFFGGRVVKDVPAVGNRIGEFQAATSPVPPSCLVAP